jgi:four helix bundle protein
MPNEMKADAYDLEERTAVFGESVIELCLELPTTPVVAPLISQFVRSATSIGANYCEADDAESKADFRHKIALCRKEARELHLIFARIGRSTDANLNRERAAKKRPATP